MLDGGEQRIVVVWRTQGERRGGFTGDDQREDMSSAGISSATATVVVRFALIPGDKDD